IIPGSNLLCAIRVGYAGVEVVHRPMPFPGTAIRLRNEPWHVMNHDWLGNPLRRSRLGEQARNQSREQKRTSKYHRTNSLQTWADYKFCDNSCRWDWPPRKNVHWAAALIPTN